MIKKFRAFFEGSLVIFFTSAVAALALIIWFGFHLINIEKHKIQTALEMEATRLERAFADRVEHTFALIQNINSQISKNPQSKNHINAVLEKFKTTPELSDTFSWTIFSWSNVQNKIIVDATYGIMTQPYDLSDRDYMPLTKSEPLKFHLGQPVLGSTSKQWMIPGGVGAVDKNGDYIGATTIGFAIDSLSRSLHKALQNSNVSFELFDAQNHAILHANHCSFGASNMIKKEDAVMQKLENDAQKNEFGMASNIKLFGDAHAIVIKKFNDFPYFAFLTYDKKELHNQVWKGLISRSIEIISLFLIAAILLFFIYKNERAQKEKILLLKSLIEKTNAAKNEFIFESAQKFKKIKTSEELADFINDMIALSKKEEITDSKDPQADILRIVKRSVILLETIADSSNTKLIKKIEEVLQQLSDLEPQKVKQIIINLMPKNQSLKVEIHNDNDES